MFDTQELIDIQVAARAQAERKTNHPQTRERYKGIERKVRLHLAGLEV